MTQTVYVDGNNVRRIVDSGPPGPPGFVSSGLNGPTEMLPLAMSRMAPWCGWSQFDGYPISTASYHGVRQALAYAAAPIMTAGIESSGFAPIFVSGGQEMNFSTSAMLANYTGGSTPEGCSIRVTAECAPLGELGVEGPVVIHEALLAEAPGYTSIPTVEEVEATVALATAKSTFILPPQTGIVFLQIDVLDSEGVPLDPEAEGMLEITLTLVRVSMWEGSAEDTPVVNPNSGHTWLGMQNQTSMMTRYGSGFTGEYMMAVAGMGFNGARPDVPSAIEGEPPLSAQLFLELDDEETPTSLVWAASKLRSSAPPVHDHDVVRKVDLGGQIQYSGASGVSGGTDLLIDKLVTTVDAADQELHVPNPGPGKWSVFTLKVTNPDVVNRYIDFTDCDLPNWPGGSSGSGIPPGPWVTFKVLVTGTTTIPTLEVVEE